MLASQILERLVRLATERRISLGSLGRRIFCRKVLNELAHNLLCIGMNDNIFETQVNGQREFVRATDQDHANRIAAAMSSRVQESTINIEDDFRDMMPTSEEFYAN